MAPSPKTIERALTRATERFAAELAEPQGQAPPWSDFEWQMARAAGVLHGVIPLLAGALRWSGPPAWEAFVIQQHRQTLLRHHRIEAVIEELEARATVAGVALVALKGSALHALGMYSAGDRPMADIDLLVRPADVDRAAGILAAAGYVQSGSSWKDQTFVPALAVDPATLSELPLGEHVTYPVKIELHFRVAQRLPVAEVDITALIFPQDPKHGLNRYSSTNILLLHLLLHAAGDLCHRSIRLIHLNDIARFAETMRAEQWNDLLNLSPDAHSFWWAFPPLEILNRYRPGLVPKSVLDRLRPGCPWPLRRLFRHVTVSQLSLATLTMQAFPATRWCATPSELLRYVRSRILPSREDRDSWSTLATALWMRHVAWAQMGHWRRIIHWLFTRKQRPATMYIVNAALQHPGV